VKLRKYPRLSKALMACLGILAWWVFATNARAQTWNLDANGSWNKAANWSPATIPNGIGASATLGGVITANRSITLGANVTVGSLVLDNANSYAISGNTLTFQVASGSATLAVNHSNGNGAHTISSALALASSLNLNQNSTGALTLGGVISGAGGLTKGGSGNLILSGANTFTGTLLVNAGTVTATSSGALGVGSTGSTVAAGATVSLQNNITIASEPLTLAGAGVGGGGALVSSSGNNRWGGNITLSGDATITSGSGAFLSLGSTAYTQTIDLGNSTLTFDGSGNITNNSAITGTGSVVKTGTGTVHYYTTQLDTYTGTTTVKQGTLILDNLDQSNASIVGNVVVGDNVNAPNTATLSLGVAPFANNLISDTSQITINQSGRFRLNGQSEVIGPLTMQGGSIDTVLYNGASGATPLLYLNADVTSLANANYVSTITGNVALNGATRTFNVAAGGLPVDMSINGVISGAIYNSASTGGGITKTGAGVLELAGAAANTYTGPTTVSGGTLSLNKSSGNAIAPGGSITINAGGTLLLAGANQIGDAVPMTLNGGTFKTGGNNETLGTLTLSANSTIDLGGGTGTLSFASSGGTTWNALALLTLQNWTSGSDHLFFGSTSAGLTASQLSDIRFSNPSGYSPGIYGATILASGEIVPFVPEPATLATAALLIAALAYRERRPIRLAVSILLSADVRR